MGSKSFMKIPKKITPDNLKDTIIQIIFNPAISPELVLGAFYYNCKDTYDFIGTAPGKKGLKLNEKEGFFIESIEKGFFLDKNSEVKVNVTNNAIVFNCYGGYIGWEKYYAIISATITRLFEAHIIESVLRIGIRFISQFENINLFEKLNIKLSLELPNQDLSSTQIRTEFEEDPYKVILTIINKAKNIPVQTGRTNTPVSIVDIDVIQLLDKEQSPSIINSCIDNGHFKQKVTFFSLLTSSFLASLNPEY